MHTLTIRTRERTCMVDITRKVQDVVKERGIISGICTLFVPHTTAGITINENADPDVVVDMIYEINKIVPFDDNYRHIEGNSAAHIKASLFGFAENIIINNGRLILGTWQGIYFCEFDGPRTRNVYMKIQ